MNEISATILTIVTTLGGWEAIKYIINRRSNTRIKEAEADSSEFEVLRKTIIFLQEQLQNKEERFAEQTGIVRKLTAENLDLTRENTMLKTDKELKFCVRRNCADREPQTGY